MSLPDVMVPMPRPNRHVPFLTRVQIRDYKSIAKVDVRLGAFTILVGRNGSGKSNFLDALRFVADSLRTSLAQAVQARGVVYEIKRRGAESPSFSIGLRLAFSDLKTATYSLSIRTLKGGAFSVGAEALAVHQDSGPVLGSYSVADGEILECSIDNPPPPSLTLGVSVGFAGGFPFVDPCEKEILRFLEANLPSLCDLL